MPRAAIPDEPNGHVTIRGCEVCRTACGQMRWASWGMLFLFVCGAYAFSWNNKAANQSQFQANDAKVLGELTIVRETALVAKGRSDALEVTFIKLDMTIDKLGVAVVDLRQAIKDLKPK